MLTCFYKRAISCPAPSGSTRWGRTWHTSFWQRSCDTLCLEAKLFCLSTRAKSSSHTHTGTRVKMRTHGLMTNSTILIWMWRARRGLWETLSKRGMTSCTHGYSIASLRGITKDRSFCTDPSMRRMINTTQTKSAQIQPAVVNWNTER